MRKLEVANAEYDQQSHAQLERLREISEVTTSRLEAELLARKEKEDAVLSAFEQKTQLLRKEIEKERQTREDLFAQVAGTLEEDLPTIMNEVLADREGFEEAQERVEAAAEDLLEQSDAQVREFGREQQEQSQRAFGLIRDLTKRVKGEFEQEKAACEATHEEVINYVEEACNRMSEAPEPSEVA